MPGVWHTYVNCLARQLAETGKAKTPQRHYSPWQSSKQHAWNVRDSAQLIASPHTAVIVSTVHDSCHFVWTINTRAAQCYFLVTYSLWCALNRETNDTRRGGGGSPDSRAFLRTIFTYFYRLVADFISYVLDVRRQAKSLVGWLKINKGEFEPDCKNAPKDPP